VGRASAAKTSGEDTNKAAVDVNNVNNPFQTFLNISFSLLSDKIDFMVPYPPLTQIHLLMKGKVRNSAGVIAIDMPWIDTLEI
jgi:hypothetical protein